MKIAYSIDTITALGGIERVTIAKANALADVNNNTIYLFVTSNHGTPVLPVNPKIKIIDLHVNYYEDYGKSRFQAYQILYKKRKEHKKKLTQVINEIQPDILISTNQSEKHFIKSLLIPKHIVIIREIHFCTNYRLLEAKNSFHRLLAHIGHFFDFHWNTKRIDQIVLLTNEDKELHWKGNNKVSVIPNPIIYQSPYPPSTTKEKRVIAAGRLVYQKNFASLINAWKQVVDKHPDWTLEIYGEGGLKLELESLITKLNLKKHVFLRGRTTDIFKVMSNSSLFVLSSIYEGFGLVIVEAMSCGLPIISYACPCGPKDIITDGKDGFLVPCYNEEILTQKICYLIENEKKRQNMGLNAIEKAQKYQTNIIIQQWMNLFQKLVNKTEK